MTHLILRISIVVFVLASCCHSVDDKQALPIVQDELELVDTIEVDEAGMSDRLIELYESFGLVSLDDNRFMIELAYSGEDNFMGIQLYDTIDRVFLQREVVDRLYKCQDYLDSIQPGYRLKVFDGVRPQLVQREMWDALDSVPAHRRGKFVSNPIMGSVHNFGCAVDITICDTNGVEIDMGAGYDDFRPIAFPSREKEFLETGELSRHAYQNRLLLRRVMRSQQFYNIPSEWWHFNAFRRPVAEARFEILLDESGHHQKWKAPILVKDSLSLPSEILKGEEL